MSSLYKRTFLTLILFILTISSLNVTNLLKNSYAINTTYKEMTSFGTILYNTNLTMLYVENTFIRNSNGNFFLIGCNVRGRAYNALTDGKFDDFYTDRYLDAENIKSFGFNTIRLNIPWELIETSSSPSEFTYDEAFIEFIRQTVEAYNDKGIYVYLDLHPVETVNNLGDFIPTLGNDCDYSDEFYSDTSQTSAREHLKRLWLKLSEMFKDNQGVAGYGILNEPHRSSGSLSYQQIADLWFDMADYVISALRGVGDDHIIFVNFAPWARSTELMSRKLNDNNVVYEVHFYYGINEGDLSVINNDYSWLEEQFITKVNLKMLQFNVPFIMGEQGFGGYQLVDLDEHDIWLKNVLTIHRNEPLMQGWLYYCYISYNGNMNGGGWQNTIVDYL